MPKKAKTHANRKAADKAWAARCEELRKWAHSKGRLPARHADAGREKALAAWVSYCQQKHRAGWFTAAQLRALRAVPFMKARIKAWGAAEVVSLFTMFKVKVQALQKWVKGHGGALPKRNKTKGCAEERVLAAWLGALQQKRHAPGVYGALSDDQLALLRKVPGMKDRIAQWDGLLMLKDVEPAPSTPKARKGGAPAASTPKRKAAAPPKACKGGGPAMSALKRKVVGGASTCSLSKRWRSSSIAGGTVTFDQLRSEPLSVLKKAGSSVKRRPAASSSAGESLSPACKSGSIAPGVDENVDKSYKVGSRVSIWSRSEGKWFDDGHVTKVTPDGVDVLFNKDGLEKEVPWSLVPHLLKLRVRGQTFVVGDKVSVWSIERREWFHDGVVVGVGAAKVRVVGDGGQMESNIPLHLVGDFVLPRDNAAGKKGAELAPPVHAPPAHAPPAKAACPKRRLQEANARWQQEYGPSDSHDDKADKPAVSFALDK